MRIVHVTASTAFGGPERQMLGLADSLRPKYETSFVSFSEGGRCAALLTEARRAGFTAHALSHDTPRLRRAARELTALLRDLEADVVCCHGYKADLIGWWSARRLGIPVVAVSRGWTWENRKVRAYEAVDRYMLRWFDCVVCVSDAQARRVRRAGVPRTHIRVIRNSIHVRRFEGIDPNDRAKLTSLFPTAPRRIIGSAGRLSPEKGHAILVRAAARIVAHDPSVGFVIVGDGPLRESLKEQVRQAGLEGRVVFTGHRTDLDSLTPHFDVSVLPSFTEGLPNVVLEAMAAGVAVVATAVGGTPEVIDDGVTGHLVPAGNAEALGNRILELVADDSRRREMGDQGRARVRKHFAFEAQARAYEDLFGMVQVRKQFPRPGLGALLRRAFRLVRIDQPLAAGVEESR